MVSQISGKRIVVRIPKREYFHRKYVYGNNNFSMKAQYFERARLRQIFTKKLLNLYADFGQKINAINAIINEN